MTSFYYKHHLFGGTVCKINIIIIYFYSRYLICITLHHDNKIREHTPKYKPDGGGEKSKVFD